MAHASIYSNPDLISRGNERYTAEQQYLAQQQYQQQQRQLEQQRSEQERLAKQSKHRDSDEEAEQSFVPPPHLVEHYDIHDIIGEGAYGLVVSAVHKASGTKVAIKRINPFGHVMFCQRTLREIKLLRHFRHENIISILDIISPPSYSLFNEVYLVQELMETDLHRVIRTQELTDDHCQYFLYQTVRGLKALHSANVLHRDLKPSNLLLNANCDLKICDFGLARSSVDTRPYGGAGFMTEYVATRWYRAPEVMLSFQEYSKAIDIWSVGCILAEMISGEPLFPGDDYHNQLTRILAVLGTPMWDDFNEITAPMSKEYLSSLPVTRKQDLGVLVPKASPKALDLMKRCLTFSPKRRITVEQMLEHPYLEPYHDATDEPTATPLKPEFFDMQQVDDDEGREMMKRLVWHEIQKPILDSEEYP